MQLFCSLFFSQELKLMFLASKYFLTLAGGWSLIKFPASKFSMFYIIIKLSSKLSDVEIAWINCQIFVIYNLRSGSCIQTCMFGISFKDQMYSTTRPWEKISRPIVYKGAGSQVPCNVRCFWNCITNGFIIWKHIIFYVHNYMYQGEVSIHSF